MDSRTRPIKVLFDTNVIRFGVWWEPVIEKQVLDFGNKKWTVDVTVVKEKQWNVPDWLNKERECFPRLIEFMGEGRLAPYTSAEMRFQKWSQMSLYEMNRGNIFHNVRWQILEPPFRADRIIAGPPHLREFIGQQMHAVREYSGDPLYLKMIEMSGMTKKKDDIFHLYTAERGGMDYFLTMDRRFRDTTKKLKSLKLTVKTVLPSELVDAIHLSYTR